MKIAFASGKGGTGKTTVSANLSQLLAQSVSIVHVDLDVEEPDSGLFISLPLQQTIQVNKYVPDWDSTKCTFCGKCSKMCNFNAVLNITTRIIILNELCHSCFACSDLCPENALEMKPITIGQLNLFSDNSNLQFVEGKLNIGEEQAVPLIKQAFDFIEGNYSKDSLVILDSPPGTSCPFIETARNSDYIMLVTEPTPLGLHDLDLAVKTVQELNKPFSIIINKNDPENAIIEDYCTEKGIEIAGRIPFDKKAAENYSDGKLIHSVTDEIKTGFEKLLQKINKLKGKYDERNSNTVG